MSGGVEAAGAGRSADAARDARAGAAGDVHLGSGTGRRFIEELTEEHLSSSGVPALRWLKEHLDDPMAGLPRQDADLTSLITELVMRAESEPASEGAMQLNFDLLEQQRLEDGISAAQRAGDYEASTRLSGERAALTDRIAHAGVLT